MDKPLARGLVETPRRGVSTLLSNATDGRTKSNHMTLVHCTMRPVGIVILSNAKNLSERPFVEFILSLSKGSG